MTSFPSVTISSSSATLFAESASFQIAVSSHVSFAGPWNEESSFFKPFGKLDFRSASEMFLTLTGKLFRSLAELRYSNSSMNLLAIANIIKNI